MGALGDHRMALMHLGYKHSQGLDGFPRDLEVAYSCYANTATQTVSDDDRPHQDQVGDSTNHRLRSTSSSLIVPLSFHLCPFVFFFLYVYI